MMLRMFLAIGTLALAACSSYPETAIRQGANQAGVTISSEISTAIIRIDEIDYGTVRENRNQAIALPQGAHVIELVEDGRVVASKKVFVGKAAVVDVSF